MNPINSSIAEQLASLVTRFQADETGHAPSLVTIVRANEIVVVTLHGALTPAEKALATTEGGVAQVREFHRQLFASSMPELRKEIQQILGGEVREAVAEIEPTTGSVVHAFTTGGRVNLFLQAPPKAEDIETNVALKKAEDDGMYIPAAPTLTE